MLAATTEETAEVRDAGRTTEYEFDHQDEGTVTAGHLGAGIVASGTSYAEALVELTDVLESDEHDAETVDDPEAFLEGLDRPSPDGRSGS